ncbi:MAG TPA: M28 family peptidase [Thermoanaerobaculia bacterium]|nr:M28 family peptidase [Thermoanaerobaculia bacterium]
MKLLAAGALGLLLAAGARGQAATSAAPVPPEEKNAGQAITAERIRADVRFLASDLLEGRGPATRGDRLAETYLQSQLEGMGLKPGAPDGAWIQKVPLVGIKASFTDPAVFRSERGQARGVPGDNLVAFTGVQKPEARIADAEIVFVGYGIVAPEYRWDDYKDVDLRGKVLLMMNNDPEDDPNLFAGKTRLFYGRWGYKYMMAAKQGAAGAIIIHTTHSAGYPWQVVQTSWAGENFELPDDGSPRVQIKMWATEELSRKIAELGGKKLDELIAAAQQRSFRPVPLGVRLTFGLTNTIQQSESGNVIGMLPGSDAKLKGEAVFYTAHFDHFGVKPGIKAGGDDIYNGALDNASGVASILSVARAFALLPKPPGRSVYFAFVTGEEQGLLGSEYLSKHSPVPVGKIAVDINIDTANWFGKTRDVVLVGLGKSSIDADVVALAQFQGRTVKPDQFPDRGMFYRSDQFSFAKVGVPAAYLKNGTDVISKPPGYGREQVENYEKNNYHQPSDEFHEDWDLSGAVEDAQLAFYLGCRVAEAAQMPHWNKGDEFEAAREKALAAVAPRP